MERNTEGPQIVPDQEDLVWTGKITHTSKPVNIMN